MQNKRAEYWIKTLIAVVLTATLVLFPGFLIALLILWTGITSSKLMALAIGCMAMYCVLVFVGRETRKNT